MNTTLFRPNGGLPIPVTSKKDIIESCIKAGHELSNIQFEYRDGTYLVLISIGGVDIIIGSVDEMVYWYRLDNIETEKIIELISIQ